MCRPGSVFEQRNNRAFVRIRAGKNPPDDYENTDLRRRRLSCIAAKWRIKWGKMRPPRSPDFTMRRSRSHFVGYRKQKSGCSCYRASPTQGTNLRLRPLLLAIPRFRPAEPQQFDHDFVSTSCSSEGTQPLSRFNSAIRNGETGGRTNRPFGREQQEPVAILLIKGVLADFVARAHIL